MTEIKTDAETVLTDVKAEIAKLKSDEVSAATWVKAHWVVIALFGGIILGCIAGHFIR